MAIAHDSYAYSVSKAPYVVKATNFDKFHLAFLANAMITSYTFTHMVPYIVHNSSNFVIGGTNPS